MKLAVTLAVLLGLAATGHALKCHVCKGEASDKLGEDDAELKSDAKPCAEFESSSEAFQMTCPTNKDKSCVKVTITKDGEDDDNMRGCSPKDKNECTGEKCYCKTDQCNSSSRGWPSAVLLLSALAAAVVGARR